MTKIDSPSAVVERVRELLANEGRKSIILTRGEAAALTNQSTALQERVEMLERSNSYGRAFLEHLARSSPSDMANPMIAKALLAVAAAGIKAMDDPKAADAETTATLAALKGNPHAS